MANVPLHTPDAHLVVSSDLYLHAIGSLSVAIPLGRGAEGSIWIRPLKLPYLGS